MLGPVRSELLTGQVGGEEIYDGSEAIGCRFRKVKTAANMTNVGVNVALAVNRLLAALPDGNTHFVGERGEGKQKKSENQCAHGVKPGLRNQSFHCRALVEYTRRNARSRCGWYRQLSPTSMEIGAVVCSLSNKNSR